MSRPPAGWLSELPDRWTLTPAKALFSERREPSSRDDVHLTPSQTYGVLPQTDYMAITGSRVVLNLAGSEKMKHVEPDDFVIHLRSFQGGIEHSPARGKVSMAYTVLTPRQGIDPRYYRWLLKSAAYVQELRTTTNQLRDGQSIKYGNFAQIALPRPPDPEQRAIADFLGRETARIDTLIARQEQLISTLRERREALINHWLGGAIANSRIQHACRDVIDCPHTTPEANDDGKYEAVRTASVRGGKYRPGHGIRVSSATWIERNSGGRPERGDILFTREAPAGEACMVPDENICLGQRMVLLKVDPAHCVGSFLLWQIYSKPVQDYFALSANGSTVGNVRLSVIRSTPVWLPSIDKQRRIATHLDVQTTKIDALIAKTEQFIQLSRERRAALITAAVTGRLDIPEVA